MPSTKIAQIVSSAEKGVGRDIDRKYLQTKYPERLLQNQNNLTEMVLMFPST